MGSERQIRDEAVREKTGKSWNQWFAILDRWGAVDKGHSETAKYLASKHGLSGWWSQTVTVRHELERGVRVKGQRGKRFELSVTRTVDASRTRAFRTFVEPSEQSIWFTTQAEADLRVGGRYKNTDHDEGEFLLIEKPKRIRFTWDNAKHCPGTIVAVEFLLKERERTTVRLTHEKLATQRDRDKMWQGWSWALDSYKSYIESGRAIPESEWRGRKRSKKSSA